MGMVVNPYVSSAGPPPLPSLPSLANLKYWFAGDHDAYTDVAGTTPAANNDTVGCWGNLGTEEDAVQNTGGARPVFKTGGINGLPFLQCSGSEWFEPLLELDQPSGITAFTPFTLWIVCDNVDVTSPSSVFAGGSLTRGGKGAFRFFSNSGVDSYQCHHQNEIRAIADSGGARALSLPNIISAGKRSTNLDAYHRKLNDLAVVEDTRGVNISPTTAVTSMHFLRGTGTDTGPFVGDVYEVLYWHGVHLSSANMAIVYAYLNGKYDIF